MFAEDAHTHLIDVYKRQLLNIDPRRIVFTRVMDMNDRALRNITIGLGGKVNGVPREDHFMITVASEVMAILCLAADLDDLKKRFGDILVAYSYTGKPIYARDLHAEGAMTALMKDAIKPNLIQTLEGLSLIHILTEAPISTQVSIARNGGSEPSV